MGTIQLLSVGTNTSFKPVKWLTESNNKKNLREQKPENHYDLLKDQYKVRTDLRENKSRSTQLRQRKQKMNQKISTINQLISKLNYARINLRIKASQYNIELTMLGNNSQIGNNLDING